MTLSDITKSTRDAHGVPLSEDISVQKYFATQEAMIANEKKLRADYKFRESLSETARKADAIVSQIREQEIRDVWTVSSALSQEHEERYAGQMFPLARPIIQGTKLWKIVQRMPKGAALHCHFGALVPFDITFQTMMKIPGMHITSPIDLSSAANRDISPIWFKYVKPTTKLAETGSIWTHDYVSNTPVPLIVAADSYPLGGRAEFLRYLKTTVTFSHDETLRHEQGVDAIWRKFEKIFSILNSTYSYEPLFRAYLQELFNALVDDGVHWLELRQAYSAAFITKEGEEHPASPKYMFDVIADEVKKFQATSKGKKFWGLRTIWSGIRGWKREKIIEDMKSCLEHKKNYPHLVAAYDVVGQEDQGRSLKDLAPELIWFDEQRRKEHLEIPFFFHAGETLGDGTSTDNNLFDAALFRSRRVGHGFSLYKHPHLMQTYQERHILIESCPISNEVLRLATDILHHPLPALIAHGVPVALSNDDPNVEGQDAAGLSFDFYQTIQGFDNVGLAGLGSLAQNSVRWSNFEDQTYEDWIKDIEVGERGEGIKAKHIQEWNSQWEEFCKWVVDEFGQA